MNPPLRSRLLYYFALASLLAIVATLTLVIPGHKGVVLCGLGLVLLIPGRIHGRMFREHYRGRRLMDAGQYEAAIECFEPFLLELRRRPWKKQAIWLAWSFYSWDIEATTLNNLGAASLNLGRIEAAKDRLEEALRLDPQYPVPHFNLAILAAAERDNAGANRELDRAMALGFRRVPMEDVILLGQRVLAKVVAGGVSSDCAR